MFRQWLWATREWKKQGAIEARNSIKYSSQNISRPMGQFYWTIFTGEMRGKPCFQRSASQTAAHNHTFVSTCYSKNLTEWRIFVCHSDFFQIYTLGSVDVESWDWCVALASWPIKSTTHRGSNIFHVASVMICWFFLGNVMKWCRSFTLLFTGEYGQILVACTMYNEINGEKHK
jgi:hypothetical protein